MEQGQNININRSLEEFESKHHPLMTLRGSRITREQEIEVEPEDMSELLQFHKELLLMSEQRKPFPEKQSTSSEDAMKIVEVTTKDLEYYVNLVDKALSWIDRIDSSLERSSTMRAKLSNKYCMLQKNHFRERKGQLICQTSLLYYFFLNCHCHPFSSHHPDQLVAISMEVRHSTSQKIRTS